MSKRMVLGIAGGLTLFMLVVIGGTAAFVVTRAQGAAAAPQARVAPATAGTTADPSQPANPGIQVALSPDAAAQIAVNLVPGASLSRTPELVNYNGTVAYEVMLNRGAVYVDANSGQVLANAAAQTNGSQPFGRGGDHEQFEHPGGADDNGFGGFFGGNDD